MTTSLPDPLQKRYGAVATPREAPLITMAPIRIRVAGVSKTLARFCLDGRPMDRGAFLALWDACDPGDPSLDRAVVH